MLHRPCSEKRKTAISLHVGGSEVVQKFSTFYCLKKEWESYSTLVERLAA